MFESSWHRADAIRHGTRVTLATCRPEASWNSSSAALAAGSIDNLIMATASKGKMIKSAKWRKLATTTAE